MEARRISRRRFTPAQRDALVRAYNQSGLTQREFTTEAGISLASLTKWLRARRVTRPAGFVEIPRLNSSSSPASLKLEFPGGIKLEIPRGFSPGEVQELCQILRQL